MMQMFSFNFGFIFGFQSSFESRFSSEIHLIYSDWTLCTLEMTMLGSLGSSVIIHEIGDIFNDADVFFQFWGQIRFLKLICVPHQFRESFNLFRMDTLSLGDECVVVHLKSCYNSLNWALLYDADVFFHFRVLIRFLELICVPNQSRDSFNLFRLDTLYLGDEYVGIFGKQCYISLNWRYIYDADVLIQFWVLIRFLELICVPDQSRDSFKLIRLDTL